MPKVSSHSFTLNDKRKTFEIHYLPSEPTFRVKLPPEVTGLMGKNADGNTEREAITKATEILSAYEIAAATKRKIILVYFPTEERLSHFSYNRIDIERLCFEFAYNVLTEVALPGDDKPAYLDETGRSTHVHGDSFRVIEWTEAREMFFSITLAKLMDAKNRIRTFLNDITEDPPRLDRFIESGGNLLK